MALHDPVEDALNARKKRARLVEAGAAVGTPGEDDLNITRQFLGGEPPRGDIPGEVRPPSIGGRIQPFLGPSGRGLPGRAAPIARRRFGGQQGARRRPGSDLIEPLPRYVPPGNFDPNQPVPTGDLSEQFFNLPGPVGFARTPQGQAMLQRILGSVGRRR